MNFEFVHVLPQNYRCRICLEYGEEVMSLSEIVFINGVPLSALTILSKCANIQISVADKKPQYVCRKCAHEGKRAYKFKMKCEKSDAILTKELKLKTRTIKETDVISTVSVNPENNKEIEEFLEPANKKNGGSENLNNVSVLVRSNTLSTDIQEAIADTSHMIDPLLGLNQTASKHNNVVVDTDEPILIKQEDIKMEEEELIEMNSFNTNDEGYSAIELILENISNDVDILTKTVYCTTCKLYYSNDPKIFHSRHYDRCNLKIQTCVFCQYIYNDESEMRDHFYKQHYFPLPDQPTTNKFHCNMCGEHFNVASCLKDHYRIHLVPAETGLKEENKGVTTGSEHQQNKKDSVEMSNKKESLYKCPICNKSYKIKSSLFRHIRSYHNDNKETSISIINLSEKSVETNDISEAAESGAFECASIENGDFMQTEMDKYENIHIKQEDTMSPNDEKETTDPQSPNKKDEQFICKMCKKTYKLKSSLRRHVRKMHPQMLQSTSSCTFNLSEKSNESFLNETSIDTINDISSQDNLSENEGDIKMEIEDEDVTIKEEKSTEKNKKKQKQEGLDSDVQIVGIFSYNKTEASKKSESNKNVFIKTDINKSNNKTKTVEIPKKCNHCNYRPKNNEDLYHHSNSTHFANVKHYECIYCNKTCNKRTSFEKHVIQHGIIPFQFLWCPYCEFNGNNLLELITHNKEHHYYPSNEHQNEERYHCSFCKDSFVNSTLLRIHLKRIHKLNKIEINTRNCSFQETSSSKCIKCPFCNFIAEKKSILLSHKYEHHEEHKSFICEICNKKFFTKLNLKRHCNYHNELEKGFVCEFCGKAFKNKTNMVVHKRQHTGEKPYPCSMCEKSFADSGQLKSHIATHLNLRNFICEICGSRQNTSTRLQSHRRTHEKGIFPCPICDKVFTIKESFLVHKRRHLAKRKHKCGYCEKLFSKTYHLRMHERLHTGEKPEVCVHCRKAFVQRTSLKLHLKNHHDDMPNVLP